MNLIARQSIKYSILSYLGVAIGMFASIFLYPNDFAFVGDIRFFISTAMAIFPFIIMGTSASMVKFFPRFEESEKRLSLLYIALLTLVINTLFVLGFYVLWRSFGPTPYFIHEIWSHFPYIVALSFLLGIIQVVSKYISNFGRIAIPVIFENILPKVALIIAFCAFVFMGVSYTPSTLLFLGIIFLSVIGLAFYLSYFQPLQSTQPFSVLKDKKFTQEFYTFSGFSVLGGVGTVVATQIDIIMIGEMLDSFSTGTYAIMLSIVGLLFIPSYAVNSISGPVISNSIMEAQWKTLETLYQKVCENLFFIGSFFFCTLLAAAPSLFELMKNGDALTAIFPVLYFLGGAALFDLATGFNSQMIAYSKYYKFTLFLTVALAFLTVVLNFIFIRYYEMGVIGVAAASCISLVLFNICKLVFIGSKFRMWPFQKSTLFVAFILGIGLALAYFLPETKNSWISLVYKPLVILVLFLLANQIYPILPWQKFLSKDWKKVLMGTSEET